MQESNSYKLKQLQTSPDCIDCGDFMKKVPRSLNNLKKTSYETRELYIIALKALKENEVACMSVKCPNPCMQDHYICIICINDTQFEIYSKNGRKVINPFTVLKSVFCDNYLTAHESANIEYKPHVDYETQINDNLIVKSWFSITHVDVVLEFTAKCLSEFLPSLLTPKFYADYATYDETYTNGKNNTTKIPDSYFFEDHDKAEIDEFGDEWEKKMFQIDITNKEDLNEACIYKWNFDIIESDEWPVSMYTLTNLSGGKKTRNKINGGQNICANIL